MNLLRVSHVSLARRCCALVIIAFAAMLGVSDDASSQTASVAAPAVNLPLQVVRGLASDLAIGLDGAVYTLDGTGSPWVQRVGSAGIWSRLPGQFRGLRTGLDGSVRAISLNDQAYLLAGSWWREVASDFGLVRDVAVSPDGSVYTLRMDGTLVAATPSGQSLGRLDAADSGGYERLMVDEHGLPWLWRSNGMALRYDGLKWVVLDRFASVGIRRIASGIDGTILLVDGAGYVYRWNSVSADWSLETMPGPAFTVAIGPGGKPWYLSSTGEIWASEIFSMIAAPAVRKPPALFTRLLKWNRVGGQAQALSVGADATVITIDAQKNVWKWKGRNDWTPLPGKFKRVAAGTSGAAWGIDDDDRVRRYANGQWFDTALLGRDIAVGPKGEVWAVALDGQLAQFDSSAKQWRIAPSNGMRPRFVAVGKDGEPWIIDNDGAVFRRIGERWVAFTGISATSVSIGPEGTVYATTAAMELFWLDLRAREWKPAVGVARSVAVGPAGTPWIISERNQLFVSASFIAQNDAATPSFGKIPIASPPALITIAPPAASVLASLLKPLVYTTIPGAYVDVGIGAEGSVFAAGADGGLYCFDNTAKRFQFAAQGTIRKVIATGNGVPWVVNAAGQVAFFDRSEWTTIPDFKAADIAMGSDAMVYATQADNNAVYRYSSTSKSFEPVTTYSTGVPLRAKKIAFSSNVLWAVTPSNQLLKCADTQCQLQMVSPTDVASGPEGSVLVTDAIGGVQRWNARGGGFISVKGNGIALSVGPQGLPWLVTADGQILSSGLFALNSKSINTATCAQKFQGRPVPVITATALQISAAADVLGLSPGSSASLLDNDRLSGAVATPSNVITTLTSPSPLLSVAAGRITLSPAAVRGTTLSASYSICAVVDPSRCSVAAITVAVASTIVSVADTATLNPGATLNLLANDNLNGAAPTAADVTVKFSTNSAYLSQMGGVITLALNAPPGSVHTAAYVLCQSPANTPCSGTAGVAITVPSSITAVADVATLTPGASLNLLANDALNGVAPNANQVSVRFTTSSAYLSQSAGVLTLGASAPASSTQLGAYTVCQAPANTLCSGPVTVTITVPGAIAAVADTAMLSPGGTLNLLANDSLNGAVPLASQVVITFNTSSTYLSQANGVLTLAANAPGGSTQSASYSICQSSANPLCSTPVSVMITVPGVINAVADSATLNLGETVNLLANDSLNGAVPVANRVTVTFNTTSAYLTHAAGVVTLAGNAPPGSTQTATYSLCERPANTLCSGTVGVTITIPSAIVAVADAATLSPGATLNLLANDQLNGVTPTASQVVVVFSPASAYLTQNAGILTLANNAPQGTTQNAAYRICQSPANTLCSGVVNITITVPAAVPAIVAVADAVSLNPGGTLNLLANDGLNGATPLSSQVTVTFNTASAFLSQTGGLLTLAAGTPIGTTQSATYSICQSPANTLCSATVSVTITVPGVITAVADAATLAPGGTLNLLANDSLNGATPLSSQVNITFNTASAFLSQSGGVLTLAAGAPTGSTQTATYSICQAPANTPCSGPVSVTITVPGVIAAVADAATLSPGGTLNLLANDNLNGAAPQPSQVTVTFNTASAFVSQAGGVLTLAAGAPGGTTQTATYSICQTPANTLCSGTVNVTITVPNVVNAVADAATLSPGGTLNLLANDNLNGTPPLSSQVTVTFNTGSAFLSQSGGVLTLAAGTPAGTTQSATYSICQSPANTLCSGPVNVTITVPGAITAVADAATLNPGATLNLLANDSLNGAVPLSAQVTVTFNTASAFLSQTGGVLTLAAGAPAGSTQTATYSICQSPANTTCSATVNVTITVQGTINAVADIATLSPGGTLNLLANDMLNGAVPLSSQVTITFMSSSENVTQVGGLLTLSAAAQPGTTHMGTYSICQAPANTLCSGQANFNITVPSTILAVADTATITPGSTLNLLANDSLNGGSPSSVQVTVTFNTASAFLSQTGGLLTLAAGTPGGSTQAATYSICVAPANTTCSSTVGVTITAPITAVANPDGPRILTRGIGAGIGLNLNDTLNGVLVPPGAVNVQYTLNDNTAVFTLTASGYLQLVDDMFAAPGIYTLSYTFCEAGVATNCSSTTATINVQAP